MLRTEWRSEDGSLSLSFGLDEGSGATPRISLTVTSDRDRDDSRNLVIGGMDVVLVDLRFASGFHVEGRLWMFGRPVNGGHRLVVAVDIRFGMGGDGDAVIEGVMAEFPWDSSPPPPPPPPPPPMGA